MTKFWSSLLAGLIGGVILGIMMQMMSAPAPAGGSMPMIRMIAMIVGSQSPVVGWLYHLVNSAIIGILFGYLFGDRAHDYESGLGWGALYGIIWWVVGVLILMPLFLGLPAFAPLTMQGMTKVAVGSMIGHLVFGLILGVSYVWLRHTAHGVDVTGAHRPTGRSSGM